ncbi:hypothetical protein [Gluconobacter oxydans]|uniref:capsular polysaccharide export protein, LipB/KpsS family n=1 Tax=Gluconobacter oxydans TaxID=442 RepID=UPI0039EB4AE3
MTFLRIPPPLTLNVPPLGRRVRDWRSFSGKTTTDAALVQMLRTEKLGGAFWLPVCHGKRQFDHLVSGSGDWGQTRKIVQAILEKHSGQTICVLMPEGEGLPIFRHENVVFSRPCEPHDLLERCAAVWGSEPDDLTLLGVVYGRPVKLLNWQDMFESFSTGQAMDWLAEGVEWTSPFTGRQVDFGTMVDIVSDAKRAWLQKRALAVCVGMAWWKRRRIKQFFEGSGLPVIFRSRSFAAVQSAERRGRGIAVWVSRAPRWLFRLAAAANIPVARVEDGFLRSIGLGSDLLPPSSIVLDQRGIYFDPSCCSDLECLLTSTEFTEALRVRAVALIKVLVERNISKYGASPPIGFYRDVPAGKRILLVPGQVGDDLSIRLGCSEIADNLSLLKAARQRNPEAYIIFRPHPDVDAGHRKGYVPDDVVLLYADEIQRGGSMTALIACVDEVHTMTSLAGFEALLRKRSVVTYGQPFYAGWGLTKDMAPPIARRGRQLSLEDLVAATLILYPCYLDPVTLLPCGPEILIERLSQPELWKPSLVTRLRRVQGRLHKHVAHLVSSSARKSK